jgi:hypothetical protein
MFRSEFVFRLPTALILVFLLAGVIALAEEGPKFPGIYETSNEVESEDEVTLTFETEIFNHSGGDILGATVRLDHPFDPSNPYSTWPEVVIVNGESVTLSAEVTVSTLELDAWRHGADPLLLVEYLDEFGETVRAKVKSSFDSVNVSGGE